MIFTIHSPFLLPSFLGGKRKGRKNNKSRDFKSCLSARSFLHNLLMGQRDTKRGINGVMVYKSYNLEILHSVINHVVF